MRLELGTSVRCTDDTFGELADVVIDPISKRLTHLVVRPRHEDGLARLVPSIWQRPAMRGAGDLASLHRG